MPGDLTRLCFSSRDISEASTTFSIWESPGIPGESSSWEAGVIGMVSNGEMETVVSWRDPPPTPPLYSDGGGPPAGASAPLEPASKCVSLRLSSPYLN